MASGGEEGNELGREKERGGGSGDEERGRKRGKGKREGTRGKGGGEREGEREGEGREREKGREREESGRNLTPMYGERHPKMARSTAGGREQESQKGISERRVSV